MDVISSGRPHSRPTQTYYVPRRLLQCGLPTPNTGPTQDERCASDNNTKDTVLCESTGERVQQKKRVEKTREEEKKQRTEKSKSPEQKKENRSPKPVVSKSLRSAGSGGTRTVSNVSSNGSGSGPQQQLTASSNSSSPSASPRPAVARQQPAKGERRSFDSLSTGSKKSSNRLSLPAPFFDPEAPVMNKTEKEGVCICDRPATHVICKRCAYECTTRVQRVCPVHPTKMALMDLRECPNPVCRSVQLTEL